jgi:hypothetical protein
VHAEVIARALQLLAADPLRPVGSIAQELGVQPSTLNLHIGRGNGCRQLDKLVDFPDYAAHADSIQASLHTLGHTDQVQALLAAASRGTKRARPDEGSSSGLGAAGTSGKGQTVGAERVFDVMKERLATGKSVRGMERWTRATAWEKDKLGTTLARFPDYPEWRARIEPLAKQLGLIAAHEKLEEPVVVTRFDAHALVAALRLIEQRQRATAEGRLDDPSLKQALYTGVGIPKSLLAAWVTADGSLRRPVTAVARLPGYAQERDEICRLLTELGHANAANALPEEAGTRRPVGASAIAQALAKIAENPQRTRNEIALEVGLSLPTLIPYVGTEGANVEKIAALPDYAAHVDSIRESLKLMGRQDQAAALPQPRQITVPTEDSTSLRMPAQQLVDRANSRLDKIVAVAELLRQDPPMPMVAATESVGVSKRVVRALLDERGAIRDRPSIEQALVGIDDTASRRLDKLLARLAERLDPAPSATGDEPALKRLVLKGGGPTAPDRLLLVDPKTVDPGPNTRNRKEAIYAQNPSLVREPRSYANDRQRQPLRWLSTMLKQQFPRTLEIQCYYDRSKRAIVVSGNAAQVNGQIRQFVASGGMQRMLAEAPPQNLPADAPRTERHRAKLLDRLNPAADPHPTPNSDEIFAAMAEGRFLVPEGRTYSTDMHAERRINDYLQTRMDRTQLAGTMRPCGTCADDIGAEPAEHRGPFWLSKAGRADVVGDTDIERQAHSGFGTSITRARDGRLTFNHDTDSDSDA